MASRRLLLQRRAPRPRLWSTEFPLLAPGAAVVITLSLGGWAGYQATRAVSTGVARAARGAQFERATQAGWFWLTVVGQAAIALVCAYLTIHLLMLERIR